MRRHGLAAAAAVLFACVWTYPLVLNLSTAIPGSGPGDNVSFFWNFWWVRAALESGASVFYSPAIFAPLGVDLTLHTHTMLPAFFGATVLGDLPIAVALNLTIIAGIALNAFCAYLLADHVTGDWPAAMTGGLVYGSAPFFAAHLQGHFNLTMAWTIPLFALAAIKGLRGSRAWAVAAGVVLGGTTYIDYYYVIFEGALAVALLAFLDRDFRMARRPPGAVARMMARGLAALIVLDAVIIVVILSTGGFVASLAGRSVSLRTVFNPLQVFWILAAVWLWVRFRPVVTSTRARAWPGAGIRVALLVGASLVTAAPVLKHGADVIARGEYVTQRYFWRSAPTGIDPATIVLGNPHGGAKRSGTQWLYATFGIDTIESGAWLGVMPLVLAMFAARRSWRADPGGRDDDAAAARLWVMVGAVFLVWACGSHLMLLGWNTGMVLPQAAVRYLPIVGNARIPGRAMVMVSLSLSVLVALALARWRPGRFDRRTVLTLAAAAIAIDFMAAPLPLTAIDHPAIYATLRDRPEQGAVCELPMGSRDGFGERGRLDHRTLLYQSIHGRPTTGGFVARMPPSVARAYAQDPLFNALLDLSAPREGQPLVLPDAATAADRLRQNGIAFIMLNRRLSPPALIEFVERTLPLELVAEDEERALYLVKTQQR